MGGIGSLFNPLRFYRAGVTPQELSHVMDIKQMAQDLVERIDCLYVDHLDLQSPVPTSVLKRIASIRDQAILLAEALKPKTQTLIDDADRVCLCGCSDPEDEGYISESDCGFSCPMCSHRNLGSLE